jgi:general secretion pathway protein D
VTRLGDLVTLQSNPLIQQFRFGTRTAETSLTLRDGESVIIGGLIQDEDRKTVQKVPGLGDIPLLGEIFKTTTRDVVTTDVILTITPRIVRALEPPAPEDQAFWSGTEETYALKPLFPDAGAGKALSGVPPAGATPGSPGATPSGLTPPSTVPLSPPAGQGPRQPAPAVLSFLPPDRTILVGQNVTLDVLVSNLEDLAEGTLTVSYDPKVLEFHQAVEGELLKREGSATVETAANPATGMVVLRLKRAEGAKGVSGAGVLATLAFTGKGAGSSPVAIQSPRLLTAAKAPLPATGGQGNVRVQ